MAIGIYKTLVNWKIWLFIHHLTEALTDSSYYSMTYSYSAESSAKFVKRSTLDLHYNVSITESMKQSRLNLSTAVLTESDSSTKFIPPTTTEIIGTSSYSVTVGFNTQNLPISLVLSKSWSSSLLVSMTSKADLPPIPLTTTKVAVVPSYSVGLSKQYSQKRSTPVLISSYMSSLPSVIVSLSKSNLPNIFLSTTTKAGVDLSKQNSQRPISSLITSRQSSSTFVSVSSSKPGEPNYVLIIAPAAGGFVFLVLVFILIFCWKRRRLKRKRKQDNYSKYFTSALSSDELFDGLTDDDKMENNLESQVQVINILEEGEHTIFPLSFLESQDKYSSDVIPSNDSGNSNGPQNQEDSTLAKDIQHDLSNRSTGSSTYPEKEVILDANNKDLCSTDAAFETPAKDMADTELPDDIRDSMLVLQTLDQLLERECTSLTEPTAIENVSPAVEKIETSNNEIDQQNCEEDFIVLYSCCASSTDELTLTAGVIVSVVETTPSGWSWVTNVDAGAGWFPSQYLEPLDSSRKINNETEVGYNEQLVENYEGYVLVSELAKGQKNTPDFVVFHSFCASNPDELSLEKDAVVSIIENRPSGWSWVTNKDFGTGWFPTCYLKPSGCSPTMEEVIGSDVSYLDPSEILPIKDVKVGPDFIVLHSFCASNSDELTLEKDAVVSIIENRPSGWSWVTNKDFGTGWVPTYFLKPSDRSPTIVNKITGIDEQGSEDAVQCESDKPGDYGSTEENQYVYARPDEVQAIKKKGNYEEYEAIACRASHAYNGSKNNELSFEENETILVLEEAESGWWRGSTYRGEGWFPASYVEALSETQDECATKLCQDENIRNELPEEENSHCKINDTTTDISVQTKQGRPLPTPAKRNNKEKNKDPVKLNEAEPEGVILLTSSQSGLPKLIKISNRRSTIKPLQSNVGPPPQLPVPVPPPRKYRRQAITSVQTIKKEAKTENSRGSRPQKMPRNGKTSDTVDQIPAHVPRRPPPPTPEKLKIFHNSQKGRSKQTEQQRHSSNEEDLNKRKLGVSANNISTDTNYNVDGSNLIESSEDMNDTIPGPHIQNQKTAPKPKQRKRTCSVDKEDSNVHYSSCNADIPEDSNTNLERMTTQIPEVVPILNPESMDSQTTSPKARSNSSTEQDSPTTDDLTQSHSATTKPMVKPRTVGKTGTPKSSTDQDLPTIKETTTNQEPMSCTNISEEIPRSYSSSEQKSLTNNEEEINTEHAPTYVPDVATKGNSPTEESYQKQQPTPENLSSEKWDSVCVGESSCEEKDDSSPKRENTSRPKPKPRAKSIEQLN